MHTDMHTHLNIHIHTHIHTYVIYESNQILGIYMKIINLILLIKN